MRPRLGRKQAPYVDVIEKCASSIERPEARLRFLNHTIARHDELLDRISKSSSPVKKLIESRFLRWVLDASVYQTILEELARPLTEDRDEWRRVWDMAPRRARLMYRVYQSRYVIFSSIMVLLVGGLVGAAVLVRRSDNLATAGSNTRIEPAMQGQDQSSRSSEPALQFRTDKVWLVEKTASYERYSNGGRILTRFETANHPRLYRTFKLDGTLDARSEERSEPAGILFHSSESEILPFTSVNSEVIQSRSEGLAEYVRRSRSYNYLIDRYGEVYRIVRDDHAANHAGYSIWADAEQVFVGLNESFLGICFESTSAANPSNDASSGSDQLTEAQLTAGRALIGILRSKYRISEVNCTAHGLVSVNPERWTIAHHHDWIRGFPFALFGLTDKYAISPASIAVFGFTTDAQVLEKLDGKLWAGAVQALKEVAGTASSEGVALDDWQKVRRELFKKKPGDRLAPSPAA
jgi:N-acetylmuramoyl-L-alanine amidase